jgi:hypothetical protein
MPYCSAVQRKPKIASRIVRKMLVIALLFSSRSIALTFSSGHPKLAGAAQPTFFWRQ